MALSIQYYRQLRLSTTHSDGIYALKAAWMNKYMANILIPKSSAWTQQGAAPHNPTEGSLLILVRQSSQILYFKTLYSKVLLHVLPIGLLYSIRQRS